MIKNECRGCRKCAFSFFWCFIFLYFILAVALSNLRKAAPVTRPPEPKNSPPVKTDPAAPVNCKVVEIDDADPGAAAPPSLVEVPGWGNINTPPPPQDSWQPPPQDSWQPSSSSWDHSSSATRKVVYVFNCQNDDCNQAVNSWFMMDHAHVHYAIMITIATWTADCDRTTYHCESWIMDHGVNHSCTVTCAILLAYQTVIV